MNGGFFIIIIAMLGFMYLLLIRPQRQQQRRHKEMLAQLGPGDEVVTVGGIYGDVKALDDEKVTLEIAEDVWIEVARKAIASVVPPEPEDYAEDEDEEPEQSAEDVEELEEPAEAGIEERAR